MDARLKRRLRAGGLASLLCVGVLAGCGGDDDDSNNADRFEGEEREVAELVDEFVEAARDKDGERICEEIFTPTLAKNIERESNQSCATEVEEDEYELEVTDINVSGDAANAAVSEPGDRNSILHLVRAEDGWRVLRVTPAE